MISTTTFSTRRALLDGATIKDTVNAALLELCERDLRQCLFAHIQRLAAADLGDAEVMAGARRDWPAQ